jgi:uncharacterized protein YecT (DUF1311 family)
VTVSALDSLVQFLRAFDDDRSTRFFSTMIDLRPGEKGQAIVYLIGNEWCGTGGCTTLVLAQDGSGWKLVTKITVTRPPIRVLGSVSNGWRDISVGVRGEGGNSPGYFAELRFDGKSYPTNPSIPPAAPLAEDVEGQVVVPPAPMLTPLYPETAKSSPQLVPGNGPSFDCANATTRVETLVCADSELAAIDRTMATVYRDVLRRVPADQSSVVRQQQREWFSHYSRICDSILVDADRRTCIIRFLSARTKELQSRLQ